MEFVRVRESRRRDAPARHVPKETPLPATTDTAALRAACLENFQRFMGGLSRDDTPYFLSLELTMAQLKAMLALSVHGPLTVGALAHALGIGEPSASLLVDRLVDQAMATREPDSADRRRTHVRLTPAATELVERLRHLRGERLGEWLGQLGDAELAHLADGLAALVRVSGGCNDDHACCDVPAEAAR